MFEIEYEIEPGRLGRTRIGPDHPRLVIGRGEDCDVTTKHKTVSRRHCEFAWINNQVNLKDLESSAGTFLNGRKIRRSVVRVGDTIKCGKMVMVLCRIGGTGRYPGIHAGDDDNSGIHPSAANGTDSAEERYEFRYTDKEGQQEFFAFSPGDTPAVLGRGRHADIVLIHPTVSRQHCQLEWKGEQVFVTDLKSSAGTYLDDKKIANARLKSGETLRCGKLSIAVTTGVPADGFERGAAVWYIVYSDIEGKTVRVPIGPESPPLEIGRSEECAIFVPDSTIGRRHCVVTRDDNVLVAKDLGSLNGTFVNGDRIEEERLAPGDMLVCGKFPMTVEGPQDALSPDEWTDDWDDDWADVEDMAPPSWHLLYKNDEGIIEHQTLSPTSRLLAVGSDSDCDICSTENELEQDHCEVMWEEGVLVAKDLRTQAGSFVKEKHISEEVLKNGDMLTCGTFTLHAVRGSEATVRERSSGMRSENADLWAEKIKRIDDELCVLCSFEDFGQQSAENQAWYEVAIWGDGEARLDRCTEHGKDGVEGNIQLALVRLLVDVLVRAGFPDHHYEEPEEGEFLTEFTLFLEDDEDTVALCKKALNRSETYREIAQLMTAVASLLQR